MKRFVSALTLSLSLVLVGAACTPMDSGPARTTTVASVDLTRYAGTWFELGSVKQFFSVGLANTTANYALAPDGASVVVVNRGIYPGLGRLESSVVGSAIPVDASNARLNVSFTGSNSASPPGNYWVVALDADYQWAVVSDRTGLSGFILSRTATVPAGRYVELVALAAAAGVDVSNLTPTPQGV